MKIPDNIYLLESTKGSFAYIIKGPETVMIDTSFPWVGKRILKELESIGVNPSDIRHILLTHHDVDHIGNAAMLQKLSGAQVWAGPEDVPFITGEKQCDGFKKTIRRIFRPKKPDYIKPLVPGSSICSVQAIPSPGHTPGHTCYLYQDVLFAGDLVENKGGALIPYPAPWNWDDKLVQASFEKIKQVPHKRVCPAHGRPVGQAIK